MNEILWKDIIYIKGEYILEEQKVFLENANLDNLNFPQDEEKILEILEDYCNGIEQCIYDCTNFFKEIRKKYKIPYDEEIKTYLFDELDLPKEVCEKYDITQLGGYINGINI